MATTEAPASLPAAASGSRVVPAGLRRVGGVLGRRLLFLPLTIFLVVSLVFFLTRVVGGNPAIALAGSMPTPEAIANIEQELGLDQSLGAQYLDYLKGLVTGDLGESYYTKAPVWDELGKRLPLTLELVLAGALVALVLGVGLGVIAALRARKEADVATRGLSALALAVPDFWLGLVLVFVFFYKLGWFPAPIGRLPVEVEPPEPVTGFVGLDALIAGQWDTFVAAMKQLALPAITLGLIWWSPIFKFVRVSMLEALRSDSHLYGEACGLRRRYQLRSALRHSMTLVVTYLGILVATLIGGAILVERVFTWGGLGDYGVDAIAKNDYPAIQGFVVAIGLVAIGIYLIVDLLYTAIDPRVRL